MNSIRLFLAMFVAALIAACGGGGGGGAAPAPAPVVPPATYTISGTFAASGVAASAVSGVSVALTGTANQTTTSDASGNYSFTGLANGSYTVTPTLATYKFNPISKAVTVNAANVTAQNFTMSASAGPTYSISGLVNGAVTSGATITLSGSASGSVVSGQGGTYSFSGLAAGSYTLTPSLTGYTFTAPITINGLAANSTGNNFTATAIPVPHTLSGNVTTAGSGVLITVTGAAAASAVTDTSGNYTVNLLDGSYNVSPSKAGYTFSPNTASVTMAGASKTQNFTGTANTAVQATANGSVIGSWIDHVVIALTGGATGSTTTNSSGNYSFSGLASGQTYNFTPSLTGYTFTPASSSVSVVAGSSAPVVVPTFTATSVAVNNPTGTISGTVSYGGAKTGGIAIQAYPNNCPNCSPAAGTVIASPGAYTIRGVPTGLYAVIAQMDSLGTGNGNVNNPMSSAVPATTTVTAGATTTANVTLVDPAVPAPVVPSLSAAQGGGGALVVYNPPTDLTTGQEIATSYKLSYGTDTAASNGGTKTFTAQGLNQTVYMLGGLSGTNYFKLAACVAATCSAPSSAVSAVMAVGNSTVSGTVSYTGNATGPLYVALHNNGGGGTPFKAWVTTVTAPLTSPVSYSISGVPTGNWTLTAIIDNNNNGVIDAGDFNNANGNGVPVSVTNPTATTASLTLSNANSTAIVATDFMFDTGTSASTYGVNTFLNDGAKRIVSVVLYSGPNVGVPLDMGFGNGQGKFSAYNWIGAAVPVVGDKYWFKVTYSDNSVDYISQTVNAVLGTANLATGLTVTGPATPTPTFLWTPPTLAGQPTGCSGFVQVQTTGWYYPNSNTGFACSTTSVVYNADGMAAPLPLGANSWSMIIQDANLNTAAATASFNH